jgi:AcrR family transcriptional regulator
VRQRRGDTIEPVPTVRRSVRADARRQQILDGALAAIREQPLADVPLSAIAAHAGMKPNHVLYYFASRDHVLIAAVARTEHQLAEGRSERLREIADPGERLAEYVKTYLPQDRHDPVWKLWLEGWLRSASRAEFAEVGWEANLGWRADLVEAVQYALGSRAPSSDEITAFARRFNFLLDGIAIHVLAGHFDASEAGDIAMSAMTSELRFDTPKRTRRAR